MKHIILTLFCASFLAVAAAQEGGGFYMSPTQIRQLASTSIDPSMMGTVKGSITSEAGKPVAEANVTLIGGGGFAGIAADDVKQIRVVRGNKFQKYPAKLYITTK